MRKMWIVAVVLAVSACGSPDAPGDAGAKVATLTSAEPSTAAGPAAESKRPRYRLDMTDEDKDAVIEPFYACLKKHGLTVLQAKQASDKGNASPELRACEQQYAPLVEWEYDPANPKAADFAHAVDRCMEKKGVDAKTPVVEGMRLSSDCEREVAASDY